MIRNHQQQHHNQNTTSRKPKGQFLSQKLAKLLSKIKKKNHEDIHTDTYKDMYSKSQQKYSLEMVSKNLTWAYKSIFTWPLVLPWYIYKTFAQSAWRVWNSLAQHLREHKIQSNTDETTMRARQQARNNWNAIDNENQHLDSCGPTDLLKSL